MNQKAILPIYNETLYSEYLYDENIISKIGNFAKKVMIIVPESDWNEQNEMFLKKILASCKIEENDYLILIIKKNHIHEMINNFNPEILFLFDLNLDTQYFKLNKNLYKAFKLNHIKIALCESLSILQNDKDKRLLLWNQCIKPIFKID